MSVIQFTGGKREFTVKGQWVGGILAITAPQTILTLPQFSNALLSLDCHCNQINSAEATRSYREGPPCRLRIASSDKTAL